jgi:DNA-binding NarL/FixJ family response regulator
MSVFGRSVLIVDDGPLLRQKMCEILRREGDFDVCGEAADGHEAIEKAQQLHPDLIILDLSMRGMSGLEAVHALREALPSTPIIVFSNYTDAFVKKLALSLGVAAVISKSQNISVLLRTARGLVFQNAA